MNELEINQEFKELIPPLTDEEYTQLESNIVKDGCREPLVVWNDCIIDGHNRYDICSKNNVEYKTVHMSFNNTDEVKEWILLNQFGRRNLTPFQRGQLALKLKPIIQEKAKENQGTSTGGANPQLLLISGKAEKIHTDKELSKLAGVGHDTIYKTEKIIEKGTPEQIERAQKGGKGNTVNAIYSEIKAKDGEKVCKTCKTVLPASEFYGSRNECKSCYNSTIKVEVKNAEIIETKKCNKCGEELPLIEFYEGSGQCKKCKNTANNERRKTKGLPPELAKLTEEEVIGNLYKADEAEPFGIDDFVEELDNDMDCFIRKMDFTLMIHGELLCSTENNKKIIASLQKGQTKIEEAIKDKQRSLNYE